MKKLMTVKEWIKHESEQMFLKNIHENMARTLLGQFRTNYNKLKVNPDEANFRFAVDNIEHNIFIQTKK